jgi:hypothetical protein
LEFISLGYLAALASASFLLWAITAQHGLATLLQTSHYLICAFIFSPVACKKGCGKTEQPIFGLLGQANLTQNDVLQFHPFTSE